MEDFHDSRYGHTRTTLDEGRIIVFKGSGNMSRDATDAYANLIIETFQQLSEQENVFVLLDVSTKNQGFTPYTRHSMSRAAETIPTTMNVYAAVLLNNSIASKLVAIFLQQIIRPKQHLEIVIRHDYTQALHWLREKMNR